MIYALNTRDISDHERRVIARQIRDRQKEPLRQNTRIIHVCDTVKGDRKNKYLCVYCLEPVHRWNNRDQHSFHHNNGKGCHGSELGLSGIKNEIAVTSPCPPD